MRRTACSLTALCLTLALTLALALPAAALEDTQPPQWQVEGYSSLEEMLYDNYLTEEEYYSEVVAEALLEQQWREGHPEEVAAFDPYEFYDERLGPSPASYHSIFGTAQDYMDICGISEEGFRSEMLMTWIDWQVGEELYQAEVDQIKAAAGGTAGITNVMVNGRCVSFPEIQPELTNLSTMIPLVPVMTYLGAQVSYDADTHTAVVTMGDTTAENACIPRPGACIIK